jgi:hypothetical protein
MRYFLTTDPVYEQVRAGLDAAFGHPISKDGRVITVSCLPPAAHADTRRHTDGRIIVPVSEDWLSLLPVAAAIESLLQSGGATELFP